MTQAREKLLAVEDLKVYFDIYPANAMPWTKPHKLKAVDGVSFDIYAGETLGIVGESGCGKSTLARAVIKMVPAEAGQVLWLGQDLLTLSKKKMQAARKDLQMIFQDPLASQSAHDHRRYYCRTAQDALSGDADA